MEPTGDEETPAATTKPTAGAAAGRVRNTTAAGAGGKAIPERRIKGFFDSPEAAAQKIPELRELSKLISASPAVSKLLKDKNLVATIFAPNNAVSAGCGRENSMARQTKRQHWTQLLAGTVNGHAAVGLWLLHYIGGDHTS